MAGFKSILLFALLVAFVSANPIPEPGWGGKHEHYVIHVPYNVHHVHHHHVKKVHVPIIKEHVVLKEIHHEPIHHHASFHHFDHLDHIDHVHADPWW